MKQAKDVDALIIDHGMFAPLALRLAREFNCVGYYCDATSDLFPRPDRAMIGTGYEDQGVYRVTDLFKAIAEADLIITPDCYSGDLLDHCRDVLKKPCWGAGAGEELELNRQHAKDVLKAAGLPYNPTVEVLGVKALRAHMQKHPDKVIKLSRWRGIAETFKYKNYDLMQPKIDEIAHRLGPFQEQMKFYVEDVIESVTEPGYDGYTVDGKFPTTAIVGYEVKDKGGIAAVLPYRSVFAGLRAINAGLARCLSDCRYRGFFSSEARVSKDGKCYPIDLTMRHATPMGEIYQELYSNLGEIIWAGAHGDLVEPKATAKYAAQVMLSSTWAKRFHQPIYYPEKIAPWVKLYNSCMVDDQCYVIPQEQADLKEIGSVVGTGNTVKEAIDACKKNASQVEGYLVECHDSDLDEAEDVIAKGEKAGIPFGTSTLKAA